MDKCENIDLVRVDLIDQTKASLDEKLTDLCGARFRNESAALRKVTEGASGRECLANKITSVGRRIPSDEFGCFFEIVGSGLGPGYGSSHLPSRFSTSSSERIRPASTSSSPL